MGLCSLGVVVYVGVMVVVVVVVVAGRSSGIEEEWSKMQLRVACYRLTD